MAKIKIGIAGFDKNKEKVKISIQKNILYYSKQKNFKILKILMQ